MITLFLSDIAMLMVMFIQDPEYVPYIAYMSISTYQRVDYTGQTYSKESNHTEETYHDIIYNI